MRACLTIALLLAASAAFAQPQAPITWGEIQWLPTPALEQYDYVTSIWTHGDTLVAVACYHQYAPDQFFPKLAFSTNNGNTFGPWHVLYDPDSSGVSSTICEFALTSVAVLCRSYDPLFPRTFRGGLWRTTDLGQTWEWPVYTAWQMRLLDQHGDTLFCTTDLDSVTWTCDAGSTFAPQRCAGFAPKSICDLAVSGQSVHAISWLAPSDTAR